MGNRKEVFTVCPRGEGKKDFWLRVGTAFENRDGSWSIVLDALPLNNKLIMREPREPREEQSQQESQGQRRPAQNAPREQKQADYGDYDRNAGSDEIPF